MHLRSNGSRRRAHSSDQLKTLRGSFCGRKRIEAGLHIVPWNGLEFPARVCAGNRRGLDDLGRRRHPGQFENPPWYRLRRAFPQSKYGLDMHELIFEPMSTTMTTFLKDRVKTAILIYESRINLLSLFYPHVSPVRRQGGDHSGLRGSGYQLAFQSGLSVLPHGRQRGPHQHSCGQKLMNDLTERQLNERRHG